MFWFIHRTIICFFLYYISNLSCSQVMFNKRLSTSKKLLLNSFSFKYMSSGRRFTIKYVEKYTFLTFVHITERKIFIMYNNNENKNYLLIIHNN